MRKNLKKIIIIGPESTGKSTLCERLATHYKTLWCAEFAREYLLANGAAYKYEDLLNIAKGQLELEEMYVHQSIQHWNAQKEKNVNVTACPLLFIDTDMYVMKVWSEFVFGKVDSFITNAVQNQQADLYLLCNIDLPWQQDELREYPDLETRQQLFSIYLELMKSQPVPWVQINGASHERVNAAIQAIDLFLTNRL